MALAATAAVAGGTAAAAYLDAKFHIRKDLNTLSRIRAGQKGLQRAIKEDELPLWYNFIANARKYPDTVCIWSRRKVYTWKEAADEVNRYAQWYLAQGVQTGQLVAFYLQNSAEFMIAWMALWAIGCAPAMINYNLEGAALKHCLKISGAELILVDEDAGCQQRIFGSKDDIEGELGMKIRTLDETLRSSIHALPSIEPDEKYRKGMRPDFPVCLMYTSGTTGMPKGCPFVTDRIRMGITDNLPMNQKPGPGGDRWYDCMPMYHGTGGITGVMCLVSGVSLAVGRRFSVRNFWKDVHDSEATFFIYVGETARYLLAAPPTPYDRDHKVRCIYGNGLRPDVWFKFQERFNVPEVAEFFNSTEGMFALLNWARGPYQAACVGHHGLILRTLFHSTFVPVRIDHLTGDIYRDPKTGFAQRVPYAEGGEIIVKVASEKAFQGYWRSPEATAKKFVHDVFHKGDIYYRTGDALRRVPDGRWFFMDRLGDTFRWKGENVSTAEVAQVLGEFPGVIEANVYGIALPGHDGRAGCAALQIEEDKKATFDYNALLQHARRSLPRYAVPVFLRVVTASVHIHNNKQNKVGLREEGADPAKRGTKEKSGKDDVFYWVPPRKEQYVRFTDLDWDRIAKGEAKL